MSATRGKKDRFLVAILLIMVVEVAASWWIGYLTGQWVFTIIATVGFVVIDILAIICMAVYLLWGMTRAPFGKD